MTIPRRFGILASVLAISTMAMIPIANARWRSPPPPPPPPVSAPHLLWSDEFTSPTLNPANWTVQTGGGGLYGDDLTTYQPQNVSVAAGNLTLTATNSSSTPATYNSGRVISTYRVNSPSYVEARIFIPYGQGYWPAFWLLGDSSPGNYTEFDVMESINSQQIDYSTYWLGTSPSYSSAQQRGTGQASAPAGWHTYGFAWTSTSVTSYLDGVPVATAPLRVSRPTQIIINLAVGGSWPGAPDATTPFPQSMLIDYVRVYSSKP
jgi:beta-glucanase (GH16 family)